MDDDHLPPSVEYVDTISLDKDVLLPDGCTTATLTMADGKQVTLIVSQSLAESIPGSETIDSNDGSIIDKSVDQTLCKDEPPQEQNTIFTTEPTQDSSNKEIKENVSSDSKSQTDVGSLDKAEVHKPDVMAADDLEDYMDVVTTYKCKFCRFSCPWKSGLMSHIRCCHLKEQSRALTIKTEIEMKSDSTEERKTEDSSISEKLVPTISEEIPDEKEESSSDEKNIQDEPNEDSKNSEPETEIDPLTSEPIGSPSETHLFLCGQCSDGFTSLEECKEHMINDHNLKIKPPNYIKAPRRGAGRPRTKIKEIRPKKKREKKEPPPPKEAKKKHFLFNDLEDEYDCSIKRKLCTGYVNDKAFRCSKSGCGHRFSSESNLHYHRSCHSNTTEKSFVCQECREVFPQWRMLAQHLWKSHNVDVDLHCCTDCNYKTFSFFKLENHRKIHSDERAFECNTCGKSFKQISQLRNHVVIHMDRGNLPEKRWYSQQECPICQRKFSDTKCLRKHQQAVHSKIKPYACSYCGHMSARKAMLELHMRQHTGEKPFVCEHCKYRTGDHNSMRRHRMRHTGDKPYKCPHCPYACIQAISYKTHLKNKHPGMEGLYSCSLCLFKSVSKENYVNHMSDHKRAAAELENTTTSQPSIITEQLEPVSEDDPSAVQMQLGGDNALQQLEGILPSNMTAAQLIYSCLSAMTQDGGSLVLPSGVTVDIPDVADTSADGTQTITIQLPSMQETENEPYYFTIQQPDGSSTSALSSSVEEIDATAQDSCDMESVYLTEQDISSAAASLDCSVLVEEDCASSSELSAEAKELVVAQIKSNPVCRNFSPIIVSADAQK